MAHSKWWRKLCGPDYDFLKEKIGEFLAERSSKKLSLFVTGKSGVGKSRLVNGLVGEPVTEEGRKISTSCTDKVTQFDVEIGGIKVAVWDSPGLQDRTVKDEELHWHFEDLKQNGFDVMLYCCRMDAKRFTKSDEEAIKTLSNIFGKGIWKKAVIALTFANKIEDPDGKEKEEVYFNDECDLWKEAIVGFLGADPVSVQPQVLNTIPIVPAGNYRQLRLPTSENWLSDLFVSCFITMDIPAALAFARINKKRLTFSSSNDLQAMLPSTENEEDETQGATDTTQGASWPLAVASIPRNIYLTGRQEHIFYERLWKSFSEHSTENKNLKRVLAFVSAALGVAAPVIIAFLFLL